MDHEQEENCNFLVRWLLGLLAVDCLRDTVDAWMDGWMDGWIDAV